MLARVLSGGAGDSENQARFWSRRRSARMLRWAVSSVGVELAQAVDQGVEVKKGARGS
jgi:hypothetical protein